MTMMIMLTQEEAEQVAGPSSTDPLAELQPVPEPGGDRWMLPPAVLDDPAHAEHKDFLAGLPQEDVTFPPPEMDTQEEADGDDDRPRRKRR